MYDARPETLLFFLGNDDLVVQNETDVYQVIIRWVRRSPLYRQVGYVICTVFFVQSLYIIVTISELHASLAEIKHSFICQCPAQP